MSFQRATVLAILVAAAALAGCRSSNRPELAHVGGRVTLDGQPLAGAMVGFQPQKGHASRAMTNADGRYELIYLRDIKGAVISSHKVTIVTADEMHPKERLPARYNRQTNLTAEVKAGTNTFDFALQSK